jgi:hypothetical protein
MSKRTFGVPPPLPKTQPTEWFFAIDGESNGPVSVSEIQDLLNKDEINIDTQIWREGMSDWKILSESDLAEQIILKQPNHEEADEARDFELDNSETRMIDWLQSWKAPVFVGGAVFVISMTFFLGNPAAINSMIWVSLLVAFWTLIGQLRGIYFDRNTDKLSYPMFFFRRSVHLSKIADANCQTKVGEDDPLSFVISLLGHTPTDQSKSKRYIVNLSGDFGARRVIFHGKYKRDQFLSLLRKNAPQCRITRWV